MEEEVVDFRKWWVTTVYICFFCLTQISASSNTVLSPGHSLRDADNQTLVSVDGTFQLGFFSPGSSTNRYLGIWYQNVPGRTVVWVANRKSSLPDASGALILTPHGLLVLMNGDNTTIWSSNVTRKPAVSLSLELLDSGNLVVKDDNSTVSDNFLWQSFDYPCDTLLAGMKIGKNFVTGKDTILTSWKSDDDPQEGQFSLLIDPRGFPQFVVKNQGVNHFRLGSWNGFQFTGTQLRPSPFLKYEFVLNAVEVYYMFEINSSSLLSSLLMNQSGFVERYAGLREGSMWRMVFSAPLDDCDNYAHCGPHKTCNLVADSPTCVCLDGFESRSPENRSSECVRKVPLELDCKNDHFQTYTGLKLPDTSFSLFNTSTSLKDCREICSKNCSCMAYADSDITKPDVGCLMWFGELADMRKYDNGGQDLFVRMSSPIIKKPTSNPRSKNFVAIIAGSIALTGLLGVALLICLYWRCKIQGTRESIFITNDQKKRGDGDIDLQTFDRATIVNATNNFSLDNKLGQGGFGPVYKGTLTDGKEIAVKTLSKSSGQGTTEFKNEVVLIAKLQHRNLVKLLGCCIEGDEKMLIYEYMSNKSLDFFIFDETKNQWLDWTTRITIVNGIAKGLLYLHEDSRLRIIHRDLKASNVLLDKDMNPKISDFGMARIFGGDQIEANTNKVVGTFGYMSPEYAIDGLFSMKSDVYSFGVLTLEIISGKKNRGFSHKDHNLNLLGHGWKLWVEGRPIELASNVTDEPSIMNEVLRCIHVGLLCVQQKPDDRPSMSSVVVMLSSDILLPQPKQPGFFTERNAPGTDFSSDKITTSSVNEVTMTLLDAR